LSNIYEGVSTTTSDEIEVYMLNSIKVNGNKINKVFVVEKEPKKDRKESILGINKDPACTMCSL
jgi:hypothetical protein